APAVLLAAVLVAVAIAMNELTRHLREAAAAAQHKVDEIAASEQRLRATLESAQVGLAFDHLDGRWVEVNEPLAAMLGRSCDEVVHGSLGEIVIADDRAALEEGLSLLRAGDVTRWDAAIHLARADGAEVAAAAFIARIPNAAAGGASLLVQLADISARSRADQLRDCAGAVRQIIVTAVGLEGALPQLLGAFCDQLDWDVAQYWSPDADGQSMRARQASTVSDAPLEGFLHASRGLGVRSGAGLIGRVWRSGVVGADEETMRMSAWPDLMRAYDQAASRQRKAPFLAGITDGSSVQVRAATAAGSWLWLQLTATSIPDSSGRPEHVLVMVEDVTAVRET